MRMCRAGQATLVSTFLLLAASPASAITVTAFGPGGESGAVNFQPITIGAGGEVFELDAFLAIGGQDLNGAALGTAAQLSIDSLPAGLDYAFGSALQDGDTDLLLSYSFTNNTGSAIADVTFLSFVDAEIDAPINTFFDEFASTNGALAAGQNFEVDEPGFVFGDIFNHLLEGALDGTNAVPVGSPDNVSMALSFALGPLGTGETAIVDILLSEDGDGVGPFSIEQEDSNPVAGKPPTVITYSGRVRPSQGGPAVPEPAAALAFGLGALILRRATRSTRS